MMLKQDATLMQSSSTYSYFGKALTFFLLSTLCLYPFLSYVIVKYLNISPDNTFGLIIYLLLPFFFLERFASGERIVVPNYLVILGIFVFYVFLLNIFKSGTIDQTGIFRYIRSDPFLRTFCLLLLVENTYLDISELRKVIFVLILVLIVAAITSIIQVQSPLFFVHTQTLVDSFESADQIKQFFLRNPEVVAKRTWETIMEYRYSIYSWISGISVGIDTIAILSILIGLDYLNDRIKVILLLSTGIIAFLSSARWIMLNFLIVAFHKVFIEKDILKNVFKYIVLLVVFMGLLLVAFSLLGIDVQSFVMDRLLSDSALTRIYAFEVFNKVFYKSPFFGTGGVDTNDMLRLIAGRTSQIHVGWLKLLYYYGFFGGIMYIFFIFLLMKELRTRALISQYWGSFFAVLGFVVANFTLVVLDLFHHGLMLAIIFSNSVSNRSMSLSSEGG